MRYSVGFVVTGYAYIEVDADSFEEAVEKGRNSIGKIDFGDLDNYECKLLNAVAEDENEKEYM